MARRLIVNLRIHSKLNVEISLVIFKSQQERPSVEESRNDFTPISIGDNVKIYVSNW